MSRRLGRTWADVLADHGGSECRAYRALDVKYRTDKRSPLHHDNRCPEHASTGRQTAGAPPTGPFLLTHVGVTPYGDDIYSAGVSV